MIAKFQSLFIIWYIIFTSPSVFCIDLKDLGGKHFEGRYTRDVGDFEILIPRKVDNEGHFVSYSLPHSYNRHRKRKTRSVPTDDEKINFGLSFDGKNHVIELWPNEQFMSPGLVLETWGEGAASDLNKVTIRSPKTDQCHYTGNIKNTPGTRVALSLCNGMAGHIRTKRHHYYIEPVKDHEPEEDGQHLHMIYTRSASRNLKRTCGVQGDWRNAWSSRLKEEYSDRQGAVSNLKADHRKRLKNLEKTAPVKFTDSKRAAKSKVNYLEVLLVADKKFLQRYNGTDYEQFLFTTLNMVSDLFHDASVGNQIDLSLVRVIYLEKEEEELDLMINTDAEATLANFCNWSDKMNFEVSHPNHHDLAVLVTAYDICVNADCGTAGLAYVAGACSKKALGCAYCEDNGMDLGTIITHEIGHLLGSDHDSDEKPTPEGSCPAMADDYRIHVMAPWSQYSTANWSSCSRKYISEFLDNDLGKCFLDEPQEHAFKIPEMPPGVVYDSTWQCTQQFGPTKLCDMGPERNCEKLFCKDPKGKGCVSMGQPPVDGTSCGNNKWCFERKCVDIGGRPEAVNGGWGGWSSWSECSRSCGGGASYMERMCDNPTPANHGRYCIGLRRKYKLCSTEPCEEDALTFREVQCKERNTEDIQWMPYDDEVPEHVCSLVCSNNKFKFKVLSPRVKDGTSCKRGSRDKCIAGECRKIGCDWILDSDAVEDKCGVCNGDGSTCHAYEKVFNETKNEDYQKLIKIPAGCRNINVEEMKASDNYLALGAADEKTFFLNGNYEIDEEGETKVAGTVCIYSEVEPNRETIVIGGPLKEDLVIYMLNNGEKNPGIHLTYNCPKNVTTKLDSNFANDRKEQFHGEEDRGKKSPVQGFKSCESNTTALPKFHWELVEWGPCSAFCGGGSQTAEPCCIDEDGGKVANKYCEVTPKPKATSRVCNDQPCKTRWRASDWEKCDGCQNKPGFRHRLVECVKDSPFSDSVIITEDKYCKKEKPVEKESCTSMEPCNNTITSAKGIATQNELELTNDKTSINDKNIENEEIPCDKKNTSSKLEQGSLVVDKVPSDKIKMYKIPLIEDKKNMNISDSALESVGDRVPSIVDETKAKELKGQEALDELKKTKKMNEEKENKDEDKKESGKSCDRNQNSENARPDSIKMAKISGFREQNKEFAKHEHKNPIEFKQETDIKSNDAKIHEEPLLKKEEKISSTKEHKSEGKVKEDSKYEKIKKDGKKISKEHKNREVKVFQRKRSKSLEKEKNISKYNKKDNFYKIKRHKSENNKKPDSKYHKKVKFFDRKRRNDKGNKMSKDDKVVTFSDHKEGQLVDDKKKIDQKENDGSKLTNKVKKSIAESKDDDEYRVIEKKDVKSSQEMCLELCENDICNRECDNKCDQHCKEECDECQKKCGDEDEDDDEDKECDDNCDDECDTKTCEVECGKDCRTDCGNECTKKCEREVNNEK